ncbi:MAG: hypothetical protein SFZ24_06455 [Planctomycetota bacterium]|nr:hypothetical protein [Planctomycetota bacterium]
MRALAAAWLVGGAGAAALAHQGAAGPAGAARGRGGAGANAVEPAGFRVVMIDGALAARSVRLLSLEERSATILDEQQRRRQIDRREILGLIVPVPGPEESVPRVAPAEVAPGLVALAAGERFTGDVAESEAPAETLLWNHGVFGRMSAPLDAVRGLARPGAARALREGVTGGGGAAATDTVHLTNGDRLEGFLVALGPVVKFESDGAELELPLERLAAARLSTPAELPAGSWIWMSDGSVARVARATIDPAGRVSLTLAGGQAVSVEWWQVRGLLSDASRLRALASLEVVSQGAGAGGGAGRRFVPPMEVVEEADEEPDPHGVVGAALGILDVRLPGPMTVTWALPTGASRVAFTAELEAGFEPWGDCELVVRDGETEVARKRLHGGQPSAEIAVDVRGAALTVAVEAGRFGPIRDRVFLRRGMVLAGGGE